ncbi:MAG: hypothetical protein JWM80_3087 [Cyanobacteria bacterium RYN_339]|nr:hypothetical protein [Cyanobacteria bacterium RYN_339]
MRAIFAGLLATLTLVGCGTAPRFTAIAPHASGWAAADYNEGPKDQNAEMPARFAEIVNKHEDLLFRGGIPTDAQLEKLVEDGVASKQAGKNVKIKTIINLLADNDKLKIDHEEAYAKAHKVKFINIQLPWGKIPPKADVDTWFDAVTAARKAKTALYIHCTHGRDRTGSMVGVYREQYDGYSPAMALGEMESDAFGYDPKPYPWMTEFVLTFKVTK